MRRIRFSFLLGLSLLVGQAPLYAQSTVEDYQTFIESYGAKVEALHAHYKRSTYLKLKHELKPVLERVGTELDRTHLSAKGFEGVWTVSGTRTTAGDSGPEIEQSEGELQIERTLYPAELTTGQLGVPAEGEHLDVSYGDDEVFVIEFTGKEKSPRRMATRLKGWLRHGKATINASDKTLTISTLLAGPDAHLIVLPSSSQGALKALGLEAGASAKGGVHYELQGKVTGGFGSSFEGAGKLDDDGVVKGRIDAQVSEGAGDFTLAKQDDGSLRLTFRSDEQAGSSPKARGVASLTRTLGGISDAELERIMFQLNRLDLRLRYPRAEAGRYRANSRDVLARFAPRPELDPDGVEAWVLELIDSAKSSIDIAVFEFQLPRIAQALVRAQQRGVDVRLVHDADDEHEEAAKWLHDRQVKKSADGAMLQIRMDTNQDTGLGRASLMHNKFMVIDREWVWTGSTNFTAAAMFEQDNNAILLHSAELAKVYETEFEEMFVDHEFGASSPANTRWSNWESAVETGAPDPRDDWIKVDPYTSVQVYFAPDDNPMDRLVDVVRNAKKSIRFLAFSYTSDELFDAMKDRIQDGVTVQGVFESLEPPGSKTLPLQAAGGKVRLDANPSKLHHKVLIIDDEIVCTGSFNFSEGADKSNDENLVILKSRPLAKKFTREFWSIWNVTDPHNPRLKPEPATAGAGASTVVEHSSGN